MPKKRKRSVTSAPSDATLQNTVSHSKHLMLAVLAALESAVRTANAMPKSDNLDFVCTTNPSIHQSSRALSRRVLAAIRAISSRYSVTGSALNCEGDDADSADSNMPYEDVYEEVTQTTDETLEQFNAALDGARGIENAIVPLTGGIGPELKVAKDERGVVGKEAWTEMEKPQLTFHDYPIDNSDAPFVSSYGVDKEGDGRVGMYMQDLYKANSNAGVRGTTGTKHPYEEEITTAAQEMGKKQFKEADTMVFGELETTPCSFIDSESELFDVAERLKKASEIAVDLENHSVRSFQGFTCLIQISTRREDYVIDALALRQYIHRALAPLFADDETVKVMHGADKDVQWLERDFGIYVVNMFDTGQAARVLKFPSAALSYLLARFCSAANTDKKKFQLADWRKRPLPEDMYKYARSDTHYLLYICDRLKLELAKKQLLPKVWERSAMVAQKRHSKIRHDPEIPRQLAAKYGLGFDQHQMRLLEELYGWRDRKAREKDESLNYVAPVPTLFGIVRARDDARTVKGLLEKGFPSNRNVPPMIADHAEELVRLISDALDAKLEVEDRTEKKRGGEAKPLYTEGMATIGLSPVTKRQNQVANVELETQLEASDEEERMEKKPKMQSSVTKCTTVKVPALKKSSLLNFNSSDSEVDNTDIGISWSQQVKWRIDCPN